MIEEILEENQELKSEIFELKQILVDIVKEYKFLKVRLIFCCYNSKRLKKEHEEEKRRNVRLATVEKEYLKEKVGFSRYYIIVTDPF